MIKFLRNDMSVDLQKNRFGSGCNSVVCHLRRGCVALFVIEFNIVIFLIGCKNTVSEKTD